MGTVWALISKNVLVSRTVISGKLAKQINSTDLRYYNLAAVEENF